jgi:hypothetical protein
MVMYQNFLVDIIATGYEVACIFNNEIGYIIVLLSDLRVVE